MKKKKQRNNRVLWLAVMVGVLFIALGAAWQGKSTFPLSASESNQSRRLTRDVAPIGVALQAPTEFQTYKDRVTGSMPGKLTVTASITMTQAGIKGAYVEIPYAGFIPSDSTNGDAYQYFTMMAPIFSLDTVANNAMVKSVDKQADKLVIYFNDTVQTTFDLNMTFTFNQDYLGKIPYDHCVWNNLQAQVYDSSHQLIDESDPIEVKTNARNGFVIANSKLLPSGETYVKGTISSYTKFHNNYPDEWLLDSSQTAVNQIYIDVPTGSTFSWKVNTNVPEGFFSSQGKTHADDPDIPAGYTRYIHQMTDLEKTFPVFFDNNIQQPYNPAELLLVPPASMPNGTEFDFVAGYIYQKFNDKVQTYKSVLHYKKDPKPFNLILPAMVQRTMNNGYSTTVNLDKPDDVSTFVTFSRAGYTSENTIRNEGTAPATGVQWILSQPTTGSAKLNFAKFEVSNTRLDASTPSAYMNVKFAVKNALTGATRTHDGGTNVTFNAALPTLAANEYVEQVIVTPMGTDGKTTGSLPPDTAFGISYYAKNWTGTGNKWPDGTVIKQTTHPITMSAQLKYNNAEGVPSTFEGNSYSIYYVPSTAVQATARLISSDASGKKPGDIVHYELQGYNDKQALSDWEDPVIIFAVPKAMSLIDPESEELFLEEGTGFGIDATIYPQTGSAISRYFSIGCLGNDENYNFYGVGDSGGNSSWPKRLDNSPSIKIPLQFKVEGGFLAGSYPVPVVAVSSNYRNFSQVNTSRDPMNNIDLVEKPDLKKFLSVALLPNIFDSYSAFFTGSTPLNVAPAAEIVGNSAVRTDSAPEWSNKSEIEVQKNEEVEIKNSLVNNGNTDFEQIRIYDILPSTEDGRGSSGKLYFQGVSGETVGAEVYYTTLPISDLPTYADAKLADWTEETLEEYGFTMEVPTNIDDVTAVYIQYPDKVVEMDSSLDVILDFKIPNRNNQVAINAYKFSAKEAGATRVFEIVSSPVTLTTEVGAQIDYEANLPDYLGPLEEHETAGNMPESDTVKLDEYDHGVGTISAKTPTLYGYEFVEWSDEETGTTYEPGDPIEFNEVKTVTLKAVWRKQAVTITYHFNNGAIPPTQDDIYQFGNVIQLPIAPIRKGYIFAGWSTLDTSDESDFPPESNRVDFEGDLNVYALWKENFYDVNVTIVDPQGEALNIEANDLFEVFVDGEWKSFSEVNFTADSEEYQLRQIAETNQNYAKAESESPTFNVTIGQNNEFIFSGESNEIYTFNWQTEGYQPPLLEITVVNNPKGDWALLDVAPLQYGLVTLPQSNPEALIKRTNEDWKVQFTDTRLDGYRTTMKLSVKLTQNFTNVEDSKKTINGILLYRQDENTEIVPDDFLVEGVEKPIKEGINPTSGTNDIVWSDNAGFLLQIDDQKQTKIIKGDYEAKLTFILAEDPLP